MKQRIKRAIACIMASMLLCSAAPTTVIPVSSQAASSCVTFNKANTYYKICRVKHTNKKKGGYITVSHTSATTKTKFTIKLAGNKTTWSGSYYYNGLRKKFWLGNDNSYYNVYGKSNKKYTDMWVHSSTNTYFG